MIKKLIIKIKSSKIVNSGIIKKIKDTIYYKYLEPKAEAKTDKYRKEILEIIGTIFKGKKWVLSAGAFLLYYRDNTMDGQDLDILIDYNDFEEMKEEMFKYGFAVKQIFLDNKNNIMEYKFLYRDCEVDIFMGYLDKKGYYVGSTMECKDAKKITKKVEGNEQIITGEDYCTFKRRNNTFKDIVEYDYEDIKFNSCKDAVESIREIYGDGWSVYDPKYDSRYGPDYNMPECIKNAKSIVYIKPLKEYPNIKKDN